MNFFYHFHFLNKKRNNMVANRAILFSLLVFINKYKNLVITKENLHKQLITFSELFKMNIFQNAYPKTTKTHSE